MPKFDYRNIEIDATAGDSQPIVAGTRVRIATILGCYRQGMSVEEIIRAYPPLKPADVHDAIAYGYDHLDVLGNDDELRALDRLAANTPSNAELRRLAASCRPPEAWLQASEERPW